MQPDVWQAVLVDNVMRSCQRTTFNTILKNKLNFSLPEATNHGGDVRMIANDYDGQDKQLTF